MRYPPYSFIWRSRGSQPLCGFEAAEPPCVDSMAGFKAKRQTRLLEEQSGFLLLQVLWMWEVGGMGSGPWVMPSTVRMGFPHLNLSGNMVIETHRCVSTVILYPVMLTVEVYHSTRVLRFPCHAWYSLGVSLAYCD